MAREVTSRVSGRTRSMRFRSRLCYSSLVPLLCTSRRHMHGHEGERLSGLTAGGPCTSFRARPREIRISPRSSRPQEHAAHAFEPPCGLSARSQVEFAHACRAVLFPHATRVLRKLALAFMLQPAHHSGRFGCVLADMRMVVRRLFCGALGLWSAGSVGVLVVCVVCGAFVGCAQHIQSSFS